jgi:hypothetical protein
MSLQKNVSCHMLLHWNEGRENEQNNCSFFAELDRLNRMNIQVRLDELLSANHIIKTITSN